MNCVPLLGNVACILLIDIVSMTLVQASYQVGSCASRCLNCAAQGNSSGVEINCYGSFFLNIFQLQGSVLL